MEIRIITHQESCIDFLSFFSLDDKNTLHVEDDPFRYNPHSYTENAFGWSSWIRIIRFPDLNKIYDFNNFRGPSDPVLKVNLFTLQSIVKKNDTMSYDKLQKLFFTRKENMDYETETSSDYYDKLKKLNVNPNYFGVSLNFLYKEKGDQFFAQDSNVADSYNQLKAFYSSFARKYYPGTLIFLPHYGPDEFDAIDVLEGRTHDDECTEDDYDGWAELGEEEMRSMDRDSDGHWRWNID
jgi:hypothetical protein